MGCVISSSQQPFGGHQDPDALGVKWGAQGHRAGVAVGRRQVRFCQTWGPRLLSPHCLYPTLCDPMDCSPPGCSLCPWGFSRQEYWSGLPSPPPGDLPDPGIKPGSPALQVDSSQAELPGKPSWSPDVFKLQGKWGQTTLFHKPRGVSWSCSVKMCPGDVLQSVSSWAVVREGSSGLGPYRDAELSLWLWSRENQPKHSWKESDGGNHSGNNWNKPIAFPVPLLLLGHAKQLLFYRTFHSWRNSFREPAWLGQCHTATLTPRVWTWDCESLKPVLFPSHDPPSEGTFEVLFFFFFFSPIHLLFSHLNLFLFYYLFLFYF